MSRPATLEAGQNYLDTLQRQHKIALRRIERIERKVLDASPTILPEVPPKRTGLVAWFLGLLGIEPGRSADGTHG